MSRILSLDLARGFTVFFITPIHTLLVFSKPLVYQTLLVKCLTFIAEGPGAQLFMLLMGLYIAFSQSLTWNKVLFRSLILLATGVALNIIKFVIPSTLNLFPAAFYAELQVSPGIYGWSQMAAIGDILHFAGIAIPIIYAVKQYQQYEKVAICLAILVALAGPYIWDTQEGIPLLDYWLRLIAGHEPEVYFPLFPWLCYPLLGLVLGHYWKIYGEKTTLSRGALIGTMLLVGTIIPILHKQESFYRTSAPSTAFHAGIVLVWLYLWYLLSSLTRQSFIITALQWCSKNITIIYLIQWPLICWLIPFFGYQSLDYSETWLAMLLTTTVSFYLTHLLKRLKVFYAKRKQSSL